MKKLLVSVAALAMCLCTPPNGGVKAANLESVVHNTQSTMSVTNNCNRLIHVTIMSGGHFSGATLEVNETRLINTIDGLTYHAQVFEGYAPVVPYDWRTNVAHNASLTVSQGGFFGGFCTFD